MNTDRLQTILGLVEAMLISAASFLYAAMSDPAGFNWKAPLFWMGLTTAVIRGVKGYYAAGVKVPTAVLALLLIPLSACTTVHDLGGGRYVVPRTAEVRSPFGTNMGAVMLEACDGKDNPYFPWQTDYRNCQPMKDWTAFSSQGQGGQVAAGALVGLGFGLGAAFAPVSGASATASQSQSLAVSGASAPVKGRH